MKVTSQTKYKEIEQLELFFSNDTIKELKKAAEQQFGTMYDLTFAEFHACANGDFEGKIGDTSNATVLQVYWAKRFAEFVEEFAGILKNLTPKPTAEEEQASAAMLRTDWAEGILVFTRSYFGLRSFREAEQVTIGEILIAKKAAYNEAVYRRRLQKIQMKKYTQK